MRRGDENAGRAGRRCAGPRAAVRLGVIDHTRMAWQGDSAGADHGTGTGHGVNTSSRVMRVE